MIEENVQCRVTKDKKCGVCGKQVGNRLKNYFIFYELFFLVNNTQEIKIFFYRLNNVITDFIFSMRRR